MTDDKPKLPVKWWPPLNLPPIETEESEDAGVQLLYDGFPKLQRHYVGVDWATAESSFLRQEATALRQLEKIRLFGERYGPLVHTVHDSVVVEMPNHRNQKTTIAALQRIMQMEAMDRLIYGYGWKRRPAPLTLEEKSQLKKEARSILPFLLTLDLQ